ncbi:RHS repeat-associated core domain-containing protein [Patulibacter sp. NPDC049589]|uniref:RHS repeat-associated core domain-containing protein n=1 Tax=Patulibacter sp. NPDC049589 TaxID=3154731 RepID=UPI00343DFA64
MRLVSVQDRKRIGSQRRTTTLSYDGSNRLTGVEVASNAPVAPQRRSWTLGWLDGTAFLSSVTDPRGNATRIDNGDPQGSGLPLSGALDPLLGWIGLIQDVRQVKGVADRASVRTNDVESRERRYRYDAPTGTGQGTTFTTWVRNARKVSSRFTMDAGGRLTRVVEDLNDPGRDDDSPPAGVQHLQLGSMQTWNDAVNAVASSTIGIKGALEPYDTTEATTTEYQWGALGQLEVEKEYKGALGGSPGGDDERSRSWSYNTHNGPLDAASTDGDGDGGRRFVYDLATETDRNGKPTGYSYLPGEKGDIDEIDKPGGNDGVFDEKFSYDARGLVTAHQTRQWDSAEDRPDWAKPDSSIGDTTGEAVVVEETFAQFDGNGDARYRRDPRMKVWRSLYDEVGNATRVGDPRAGTTIDETASTEQPLATSPDPAGAAAAGTRASARSTGQSYVARFTFDALDREIVQAIPKRTGVAGATDRFRVTAKTFDKNDNVTGEREEEDQLTSRTYTETDKIKRNEAPGVLARMDSPSATTDGTAVTQTRWPVTEYAYDADDNTARRKDPAQTLFDPDGSGPLAPRNPTIDDPGYRTEWRFDRLGRAVAQVREGKDASVAERKTTSRVYDRRDNVVGEVDAKTNGDADAEQAVLNAGTFETVETNNYLRFRYVYDAFDRKKQQIENPRTTSGGTDTNRTTSWVYDKEDREKEQRTHAGRVTKRNYDDRGQLIEVGEPFGYDADAKATTSWAKTTIERRRDGQPTLVTSPRGNDSDDAGAGTGAFETKLRYYDTGEVYRRWVPKVSGQYGAPWEIRYGINDVGDPTTVRDARDNLITNTFLDTGELQGTDRPGWWFYDEEQGIVRERTGEDPAPTDGTTNADGLPTEPGNGDFGKVDPQDLPSVLPLKGQTDLKYNGRLQLTEVKGPDDAGGQLTQQFTYDNLGRLSLHSIPLRAATADPDNSQAQLPQVYNVFWQYDLRGNTRAEYRARRTEDGGPAVSTWRYDAFDRLTSTTEPPSCEGAGCLAPVTDQTWDRNDNLRTVALPTVSNAPASGAGTTTGTRTIMPDLADRGATVVDEAGGTTKEQYDLDDLVTKRYAPRAFVEGGGTPTNPNEKFASSFQYDGGGRVTRQENKISDPINGGTLVTSTTYDREGNPRRIEEPGARSEAGDDAAPQRVTTTLFDARGLPWKRTIGSGTSEATTITEYDGQQNLRRTVNPKGVTGQGNAAHPTKADEGGNGLSGFSAWNSSVMNYDSDQLIESRALPWDDADGSPTAENRHRWRQDFTRTDRGLPRYITGIYDDKTGPGNSTWRTELEFNYAGWPTKSTEQRRNGSNWETASQPLRYEYDEHGNQTRWTSQDDKRTIQRSFYRSGQLRVKCGRRTGGGSQEQVYSYRYDTAGGLSQIVDWMHQDAPATPQACRPGEVSDSDGNLGARRTNVQRDKAGRPVSVDESWTSGGKDTRFTYVPHAANLVQSVQTDGRYNATTDSYSGGTSTVYEYDEQDRNTSVQVRNGAALSGAVDRQTDMKWWPSGERRETKKPVTATAGRTTETRLYSPRGELIERKVTPAAANDNATDTDADTKTYPYEYDEHGNRTKDERSTTNLYNARDQLTKWVRKRQGPGARSERDPDKTTAYTDIDGAGRPIAIKETVIAPEPDLGTVTTTIDTANSYLGDRLEKSVRSTKASPDGPNTVESRSSQTDCLTYNAFGSQTQSYRQTDNTQASAAGGTAPAPTVATSCTDSNADMRGTLEQRNVYDMFERLTAGKQRTHGKTDGSDGGSLNGTQAFCFDPFDRRDRGVTGLTGAADPADTSNEDSGRTRAQTACTSSAASLGQGVAAYDYSYLGLTEQLSREGRPDNRTQSYEYTAAGERLGRVKNPDSSNREWRAYDVDAQGSVVGLEKADTGATNPEPSTGTDANKLNTFDTDPFGAPVAAETNLAPEAKENPFRFQGFYRDQDTGTYDMQARAYRPETGRFLQQDRFEDPQADLTLASDPLTASRYAFTAGNPSSRAEYDGHCWGGLLDFFRKSLPGAYQACRQLRTTLRSSAGSAGSKVNRGLDRAFGERQQVLRQAIAPVQKVFPKATAADIKPTQGPSAYVYSRADATEGAIVKRAGDEYGLTNAWAGGADTFKMSPWSVIKETASKTLDVAEAALLPDCSTAVNCVSSLPLPTKLLRGKKVLNAIEDAAEAGADAQRTRRGAAAVCAAAGEMSFGGSTLVSMADGTLKPISDVKVGDVVLTIDPLTGKHRKRKVTHVWVHDDRLRLLDIAGDVIETTEDHPFWNQTDREWQQAQDLDGGDLLRAADGGTARVIGLRVAPGRIGRAYNLTVAGEHVYHVGRQSILVHNVGPCRLTAPQSRTALRYLGVDTDKVVGKVKGKEPIYELPDGRAIVRDLDGHRGSTFKIGRSPKDLKSKSTRAGSYTFDERGDLVSVGK